MDNPKRPTEKLTILLDGVPRIIGGLTQNELERALKQKNEREQSFTRDDAAFALQTIKVRNLQHARDTSARNRAATTKEHGAAWRNKAFFLWYAEAAANQQISSVKVIASKIHLERKAFGVAKDDRRSIGTIKNAIKGVKQIAQSLASMPIEAALEKFMRGDSPRPTKRARR